MLKLNRRNLENKVIFFSVLTLLFSLSFFFDAGGPPRAFAEENIFTDNVGIGTTNPAQKLDVNGDITTSAQNGAFRFGNNAYFQWDSSGIASSGGYLWVNNTDGLYVQNTARFRGSITNDNKTYLTVGGGTGGYTYFSGSIGIGISVPSVKLDVIDDVGSAPAGKFYNQNTNGYGLSVQAGTTSTDRILQLKNVSGTERAYFAGDGTAYLTGNVGIGTTGPTALLHIAAGSSTVAPLKLTSGTNLTDVAAGAMEFDGTNLYFTPAAARKTLAFTDSALTGNAANVTGIVLPSHGGTGIANNDASTLTISGSFATTLTVSGATSLTLPTSGTVTALGNTTTGSGSTIVLAANPAIANISPSADFTLTQNSVVPFTSVGSGAVVNTLYLKAGKVGIGTTSPSQKLHVEGQCVTGDTLLKIIPAQAISSQGLIADSSLLIEKRIVDVQRDDYVLSLNESTGELEPRKIKGLLDMGIKPVFQLTTASGRTIRTTGNHPYLVRGGLTEQQRQEIALKRIEDLHRDYLLTGEDLSEEREFSQPKYVWLDLLAEEGKENASNRTNNKPILTKDKNEHPLNQIGFGFSQTLFKPFFNNTQGMGMRTFFYFIQNFRQGLSTTFAQLFSQDARYSNYSHNFLLKYLDHTISKFICQDNNLAYASIPNYMDELNANWLKVLYLKVGDEIAVYNEPPAMSNEPYVMWDKISSIKYVGYKQVYDIEVEGIHNFVANEILAHNTYISGNVGIGTTGPLGLLQVGTSPTPGLFVTSGGNVGIGTTAPTNNARLGVNPVGAQEGLRVNGTIAGTLFYDTANYAYKLDPQNSGDSLIVAGNVGIGTTSPSQKLHVEGQCVTGDTLLPVIRLESWARKVGGTNTQNRELEAVSQHNYLTNSAQTTQISLPASRQVFASRQAGETREKNPPELVSWKGRKIEYIPIVEAKPGDYVLSLNEQTSQIEPHRINGLLDMGVKPVFKLTTADGRTIKTTGNHPYLVKVEGGRPSTEWLKVSELNVGDEIAVANADLFRPNADSLGFNNEEPAFEFIGSNMLQETYRPMQNFFPGHSFNINYNCPAGFSDVKADNISEVLIKGKQNAGILQAIGKDFSVASPIQSCVRGCIDLKMQITQRLNNVGVYTLVSKDSHEDLMGKDLYRLFAQLRSEFYGYNNVFFGNTGVLLMDFINGVAGSKQIQDITDGNPGAFDAGFAKAHIRVNGNPVLKVFSSHFYNLLLNKMYHSFLHMSSLAIPQSYASPAGAISSLSAFQPSSDISWEKIISIEYLGYEHVYDIEVEGTHNFVAGHWINSGKTQEGYGLGAKGYVSSQQPLANSSEAFFGGIIAHNTYISGNVGIGTTSPLGLLQVGTSPSAGLVVSSAGNVGIGTTASSSYKLYVDGSAYMDGLTLSNGGIGFGGNLDMQGNDIINASNIGIGVSSPGTAALAVLGGNVGIGTTGPAQKLEVNGNLKLSPDSAYIAMDDTSYIYMGDSNWQVGKDGGNNMRLRGYIANNGDKVGLQDATGNTYFLYGTKTAGVLETHSAFPFFADASGTALTVPNGNVGIGTTDPSQKLEVSGAIRVTNTNNALIVDSSSSEATPQYTFNNYLGTGMGRVVGQDHTLFLATNGLSRLWINSSGNVGIGTTGPGSKLEVWSTSSGVVTSVLDLVNNATAAGTGVKIDFTPNLNIPLADITANRTDTGGGGTTDFIFNQYEGASTTMKERMRIKGDTGNVGIGTTNPGAKLHVSGGQMLLDNGYYYQGKDTGGTARNILGLQNIQLYTTADGTNRFDIDASGDRVYLRSRNGYSLWINGGISNYINLWGGNAGTGQTLYMDNTSATVGSTLQDSPTLTMRARHWNGVDTTRDFSILHDMITAGASPKSQAKFSIASVDILTLENNNGTGNVGIGTTSPGALLDIGTAGATLGVIRLEGSSSGYAAIQPAVAAGNVTLTLPAATGTLALNNQATDTFGALTDVTTNNASTSAHGFLKKLNNTATTYMDGAGNWSTPAGTGANTALSNLASVAINTSLVSDTDSTDNLGSPSIYWANTYTDQLYTTGNVGIGTTGPSAQRLHVATSDGGTSGIRLERTASGNFDWDMAAIGGGHFTISGGSDGAANEYFRIGSTGNVGIGTTGPGAKLEVTGGIKLSDGATRLIQGPSGSSQELDINAGGSNILDINNGTGGEVRVFIDHSGSALKLRVSDQAVDSNLSTFIYHTGTYGVVETDAGGKLVLQSSSGNVGIGTTGPGTALDVNGDLTVRGNDIYGNNAAANSLGIFASQNTDDAGNISIWGGHTATAGDSARISVYGESHATSPGDVIIAGSNGTNKGNIIFQGAGAEKMRMTLAGNVGIGTTGPGYLLSLNSGATPSRSQVRVTANDASAFSILTYGADNVQLGFDTDYTTDWTARDTSAALISKYQDKLQFYGNSGLTSGNTYTPTSRMVLDLSSGNVGIGTTSPLGLLQVGTSPAPGLVVSSAGNVGIGTTASSSYKLYVDGSAYMGGLTLSNGGIQFGGDLNMQGNDIVNASNIGIGVSSPGTAALAVLGGNVGIGTTGPGDVFVVKTGGTADTFTVNTDANVGVELRSGTALGLPYIDFTNDSSTDFDARIQLTGDNTLALAGANFDLTGNTIYGNNSASGRLTLDSTSNATKGYVILQPIDGNVGIGTTGPAGTLDVRDGAISTALPSGSALGSIAVKRVASGSDVIGVYGQGIITNDATKKSYGGYFVGTYGSARDKSIGIYAEGNDYAGIFMTGNVGIGTTGPAALLHIAAGSTTVAPLKLTSGTNLTAAAAGAMEFDGTSLYFTPSATRKTLAFTDSNITGTAANVTGTILPSKGGTGIANNDASTLTINGSYATTLTVSGATSLTLPTSGTVTALGNTTTGSGSTIVLAANPAIANISPSADFTLTQNSVVPFTSVGSGAVVNTLYLKAGKVGIGTTEPTNGLEVIKNTSLFRHTGSAGHEMTIASGDTTPTAADIVSRLIFSGYDSGASAQEYGEIKGIINTATAASEKGEIHFEVVDSGTVAPRIVIVGTNVGIGTTSPTDKLHVIGNIKVGTQGDNWQFARETGTGNLNVNLLGTTGDAGVNIQNTDATGKANLYVENNVGIGTTGPTIGLDVRTTSGNLWNLPGVMAATANGYIALVGRDTEPVLLWDSDTDLRIGTGGSSPSNPSAAFSEKMRITTGGNVGIGTTGPGQKLDVSGNIAVTGTVDGYDISNYGTYFIGSAGNSGQVWKSDGDGAGTWGTDTDTDTDIYWTGTATNLVAATGRTSLGIRGFNSAYATDDAVYIKSDGNVGIGTTAPGNKLVIKGTTSQVDGIFIQDPTASTYGARFMFDDANTKVIIGSRSNNVDIDHIVLNRDNGNVGIGTTNPLQKLDIAGGIIRLDYGQPYSSKDSGGTTRTLMHLWNDTVYGLGADTLEFRNAVGSNTIFSNGSTPLMIIKNTSGNVGIGTTSPLGLLQVGTSPGAGLVVSSVGNVGIGTTASSSYKLYVDGSAYMGGLTLANGGIGFGGNLDMKGNDIINASNIGIGVSSPGTAALAVLGGNVGIGTTGPAARLQVATPGGGNLYVSDYGCGAYGGIGGSSTLTGCANYALLTNATDTFINRPSGGALWFREANGNQMIIKSGGNIGMGYNDPGTAKLAINGNVGIGTTAPGNYKLYVSGNQYISGTLTMLNNAPNGNIDMNNSDILEANSITISDTGIGEGISWGSSRDISIAEVASGDAYNAFLFRTSASFPFVFNTGNVGIGTTAPGAKLDVTGDINIGANKLKTTNLAIKEFDSTRMAIYDSAGSVLKGVIAEQIDFGQWQMINANGLGVMRLNAGGPTNGMVTRMVIGNGDVAQGSARIITYEPFYGGDTAGADLYLRSTTHATKGDVIIADDGGNVGIGTTNPQYKLHLAAGGSIRVDATVIGGQTVNTDQLNLGFAGTLAKIVTNDTNEDLTIDPNGTGNIIMQGNVGIGTTSPGALLDIGTAGITLGVIRLEGSSSGYAAIQPAVAAGNVTLTLPAATGTLALSNQATDTFGALTDVTTNNASTSAHGFLSKLNNSAATYMDGAGSWSTPAGTGANTALSNLASVAINTSLVSDTDSTDNLGSPSIYWANTYTDQLYTTGNVGIGTTGPASGTKLDVRGRLGAYNSDAAYKNAATGGIQLYDGAPRYGIYFTNGHTNSTALTPYGYVDAQSVFGSPYATVFRSDNSWNWIWSASADTVAGVNIMELDSSDGRLYVSGNVGIGTTGPNNVLEIKTASGDTILGINPTAYSTWARINFYEADLLRGYLGNDGASNDMYWVNSYSGGDIILQPSGNVGIGTTGPNYKLEVNGAIGTNLNSIYFQPSGGSVGTDGTYGLYWHNSSGVTGDPNYSLARTAGGWSAPNYQQLQMKFITGIVLDPGSSYGKSYVDIQGGGLRVTSGNVGIGTTSPLGLLQVGTSPSPGLVVSSVGNVGIGTTASSSYKLYVDGSAYMDGLTLANGGIGFGGNLDMKGNDIINASNIGIGVSSPGTAALAVLGGNVGIGTASPSERLEVGESGKKSFEVRPGTNYVSLLVDGVEVARLRN